MPKVCEIADYLERRVPARLKLDFDNVGLLVGLTRTEVTRVLVALDVTLEVIGEARDWGAQLIVAHHPILREPVKRVVDDNFEGRRIAALLGAGISAVCLHTNLDSVAGGVSDALAEAVGAVPSEVLEPAGTGPDGREAGIGRVCGLPEAMELGAFLEQTRAGLGVSGLRYYDAGRPVRRLALCGGSGGDLVRAAAARGCDTFLAGEIKYNFWLDAKELGLNLVEADHFCTENVVTPVLRDMLLEGFPALEVRVSQKHRQTSRGL